MALWNSLRASGDAISANTLCAPADSPKMVTLSGSPPNTAMFFCTHLSAAIWSSRPKFIGPFGRSASSAGCAKKPSWPRR